MNALVTGGSGYFGSLLVARLLDRLPEKGTNIVRVLDLVDTDDRPSTVEFVEGDIRETSVVREACTGMDVVFHNVAQVPLARDTSLTRSVNITGTEVLLDACEAVGVGKVVSTSSSAVFGVPEHNPVMPDTPPHPREPYGQAKLEAEYLCRAAVSRGLDVTIIRPRTILGHGRLGIFAILFDWIADGIDVFVLGAGDNVYQFVHADDLADACILAGERPGPSTYNIGAGEFGTMRETLEALCAHASTGSRVRSLPAGLAASAMRVTSAVGLTPFANYHWLMYGQSMWFDTSNAEGDLGWKARWSNGEMFEQSYDWFLEHRANLSGEGASQHRSAARQGALSAVKSVLKATRRD
ncbi:MAG: NAD-dependent epimerase/dehydratase family protein [Acidimicrobiia bacterium]|nr:NAD-dependent epimerase/dehydratase family protein [Acidimicrobiia bacterium]